MALTKISRSLLDTGISDSSDATAVTIDSSENVGINNSSPIAKLHVIGNDGNGTNLSTSASNAKVAFRNTSGSSLTSNQGYTGNSWYNQISNGNGTTAYDLSLNPFGGKVSVGTDDPSAIFQIHGGSTDYDPSSTGTGLFHITAGATSNYTGYIGISDSGMSLGHNGGGSRYLRFDTNETERMRIDSSGNVGIGTTTINSGTLGSSNKFLEVAAGTASGSGTLVLSRNTSTNNDEIGGIRYVNPNNADDDGLDADGKLVAAISARVVTSDSNAGDDSGGVLTFSTKPEAGSFTERMRIDSSGNVGIGTTSPNTTLHTATGTNSSGLIDVARFVNLGQNVDDGARIQLTAGTSTSGAGIGCLGYALNSAHLVFHAGGNTERMRIDQAGALCIGTTGSGAATSINCLSTPSNANVGVARFGATGEAAATTAMCVVKSVNDNSTSNVFVRFGINGFAGGSGQINANGSSQAAFGTFSDRRLKENITDLPSQLDKIKAMRAVEFDYIESEGGRHQLGFIAQEIEEIYPDMVGEREDGMKTLSGLGKWEARLVKAIQEQQEQIEALQSEINLLKGE